MSDPDFFAGCTATGSSWPSCTATGIQLAKRLALYVPLLLGDQIPASIGRPLARALDEADRKQQRQAALAGAVAILDAGHGMSLWAIAGRLENALRAFDGVARKRVESGARPPSPIEECLLILLQTDGPTTQRRLFEELKKLT